MLRECLENVRVKAPLIHCITNYVTVNDVANLLLACGASPIMADDEGEAEEITSLCGGLNLNIGTLNSRTIPSMLKAGKKANELARVTVLDPVGAGASRLRTQTALHLLREVKFTAIRANSSEIWTLAAGNGGTRGVDAALADAVTEENLEASIAFMKEAAARFGSVLAVTGAIDLVTDGGSCYVIRNGRPEMSRITGTGCQLSALLTAYLAANPGNSLEAAAAAVCAMGLAGEIGYQNRRPEEGDASYRNRIIDAVCLMDGETLEKGAKYEIR